MRKKWMVILSVLLAAALLLLWLQMDRGIFIQKEPPQAEMELPQQILIKDSIWGDVEIAKETDIQNIHYFIEQLEESGEPIKNPADPILLKGDFIYSDHQVSEFILAPGYILLGEKTYKGAYTDNIYQMLLDDIYDAAHVGQGMGIMDEMDLTAGDIQSSSIKLKASQIQELAQAVQHSTRMKDDTEFLLSPHIDFPDYRISFDKNGERIEIQLHDKNYFQIIYSDQINSAYKDTGEVWDCVSNIIEIPQYEPHDIQYLFYAEQVTMYPPENKEPVDFTLIKNAIVRCFLNTHEPLEKGYNIADLEGPLRFLFKIKEKDVEVMVYDHHITIDGHPIEVPDAIDRFNYTESVY